MDETKPVVGYQKAKKNSFVPDVPGGWVVYDDTTGNRLGPNTPYATREEAEAAIPALVSDLKKRRRKSQEDQAAKAAFRDAHDETVEEITVERITSRPATPTRRYRTVQSDIFGPGRIYHDEPGATYYDDGSGRFTIQMWDN